MEKLYESNYQEIRFSADQSLIEITWKLESEDMSVYDFRSEVVILLKLIRKLAPKKILLNTRELKFIIAPELQEWINNILWLIPQFEYSKAAIINSDYIFTLVSLEQLLDEIRKQNLQTNNQSKFFTNEHAALTWLYGA